jgi:hypothetical protein
MFDGQVLPTIEEAERLPFSPTAFDLDCYVACQNQVREISTWEPSGDIDFLLVDFVCESDLAPGISTFALLASAGE